MAILRLDVDLTLITKIEKKSEGGQFVYLTIIAPTEALCDKEMTAFRMTYKNFDVVVPVAPTRFGEYWMAEAKRSSNVRL